MGKWSLMLRAEGTCKHNFLEQREQCLGWGGGGGQTGTRLQLGVKRAFKQTKLPTEEGPAPAPAPAPAGRKQRPAKGSDLGWCRGCQAPEKERLWFLDGASLECPKPI